MIVLDTTILVYAKGTEHPLRGPCRAMVEAIAAGTVLATTTPEVIQEFVHVRAQRRSRRDAAELGRSFADLLDPLLIITPAHLIKGMSLFEGHAKLSAFDAVLAAAALGSEAEALVSADATFAQVRSLNHVAPGSPAFDRLLDR